MRVLIASLKQETATFNPARTRYDHFQVRRGPEIVRDLRGAGTEIGGIIGVLEAHGGIRIAPAYAAWAVSGGPVATEDLDRLIDEFISAVRQSAPVDGACIAFHGAMAGVDEMDPEGRVLAAVRDILGGIPIVISLDLHAVITDRLVAGADVMVPFHTYPHTDQYDTGQRAARVLLNLLEGSAAPTTARIPLPMLVRGDELLTATGRFGQAIRMCQKIEASKDGLAAGVIIGNPFTDVPDLQSNVLVTTDRDADRAQREAERIARFMWENRHHFVAPLTSLKDAIHQAETTDGLTVFSDAADSTASGAPGDSNAILKGLFEYNYAGSALVPIVDAPAVDAAFSAGVGASLTLPLGGTLDRARHTPFECDITVKSLFDGRFTYEDGTPGNGGRTTVLAAGKHRILATERPVYVVGRKVFLAHGLNPQDFHLVVVKSPNGFRTHYEAISARIVPVDVPGATSANLKSLPYKHCVRPIFPLDEDVAFPLSDDG